MEALLQDLRYGLRMLWNTPGFSAVAVLALALGIGVNTAIFSIVNSVVLRPLPYEDPDRLVLVSEGNPQAGAQRFPVSPANYLDLKSQAEVFETISASMPWVFLMTGQSEPERIDGARVTADLLPLLGIEPILGHGFSREDDQPGGSRVVILSHGLWQRRFGSDPGIVGKTLTLNSQPHTVAGVLPPSFQFLSRQFDLWIPFAFEQQEASNRSFPYLTVIGRIKQGKSLTQAQAEVDTIARRLEVEYPNTNSGKGLTLTLLREHIMGNVRPALLTLLAVVGFVLLIACMNVANLLLARATTRQKEIAIRTAIGASRLRIVRQLCVESLLLGLIAGLLGLLLAFVGHGVLTSLLPSNLPRVSEIDIDVRVLAFTLTISLLTGLVFGLVPALHASKPDLNEALKEGGNGSTGRGGGNRLRSFLVVSEVALALILVIGAGLMVKSFLLLQSENPGFNPRNILTTRISLPRPKYPKPSQQAAFFQQVVERLKATPGVETAAVVTSVPIGGTNMLVPFTIEGRPTNPEQMPKAYYRAISSDYFRAMGIQLKRGRYFIDADSEETPPVALINESMARSFWPDDDPIGKQITINFPSDLANYGPPVAREIVGVVGNVKHGGLEHQPEPEMYAPFLQNPLLFMTLLVRTTGEPASMAGSVRAAVWSIDKDQPVAPMVTMEEILDRSVAQPRFRTLLLSVFAALALALAALGVYGVMAYLVEQRTREIGVRMALGAKTGDVLRLILGYSLRLTLIGVVIGLGASFLLTRLVASLLYSISPLDRATFAVTPLLIILVTLIASYVPARKAMKVDPVMALRHE